MKLGQELQGNNKLKVERNELEGRADRWNTNIEIFALESHSFTYGKVSHRWYLAAVKTEPLIPSSTLIKSGP